jgi:hypothetical protein
MSQSSSVVNVDRESVSSLSDWGGVGRNHILCCIRSSSSPLSKRVGVMAMDFEDPVGVAYQ